MKEIVFVTKNKGKVALAQSYFDNKIKLITVDAELIEPRTDDIEEIAKSKVIQAYNIVGKPCIALDSGFFIKELNGFPKAFVNHTLETIGINGILKLMSGVKDRTCEFKECLAYYDGEVIKIFQHSSKGILSKEVRGIDTNKKWSDLWYIFITNSRNPHKKTLAEMTDEERDNRKEYSTSSLKQFSNWYYENM